MPPGQPLCQREAFNSDLSLYFCQSPGHLTRAPQIPFGVEILLTSCPKLNKIKLWHLLLRLHFHQSHVSAFLVHLCSKLRVSKCHRFTISEQWPLLWEVCGTCSGFCVFIRFVALLIARNLLFSSLAFLHLFYSFLSRRFPISLSHSRRVGGG